MANFFYPVNSQLRHEFYCRLYIENKAINRKISKSKMFLKFNFACAYQISWRLEEIFRNWYLLTDWLTDGGTKMIHRGTSLLKNAYIDMLHWCYKWLNCLTHSAVSDISDLKYLMIELFPFEDYYQQERLSFMGPKLLKKSTKSYRICETLKYSHVTHERGCKQGYNMIV